MAIVPSYSRDGGKTWTINIVSTPVFKACYGVFASKKYKSFISAPEEERSFSFGCIISRDSGLSWSRKNTFPNDQYGFISATGDVEGGDDAIYVQSSTWDLPSNYIARGLLKSVNGGNSWTNIGGPSNGPDTRFCVVDCKGAIVVAFNPLGEIWVTTDGGDGTIHPDSAVTRISPSNGISITSSLCDSVRKGLMIFNDFCDPIRIDSIWFDAKDSFLFQQGALRIDTIPSLPRLLSSDASDSLAFWWHPKLVINHDTTYTVRMHLRSYSGTTHHSSDTTVIITLTATASKPILLPHPYPLYFDTVSTCGYPIDTVMTLTNHGCDTLRITSGPGNLPPEFQLLSPFSLPIVLAPDSSVTVRFRFAPTKKGNYVASASFTAEQQGLQQKVSLSLEGNGIEDGGLLSYEPKTFSFPSLSICSHDSSSGFVTNTGCSEMTIAASYFGDLDFTNTTIGTSTGTSVKPKDTLTYKVYLNPSQKGKRQGYILLYSKDAHNSAVDSIPFTVTVLDGTRILSASNSTLDFGSTSLCSEKDTTITLQNTGCDTLWVTATTLQGTGFIVEDATPFFILKGESKTITVHTTIDSTNHQSTNTAQISFTTNADNQISPIGLIRYISYPSSYPVKFSVSETSGKNQSQLSMNILADSLPAGLTRLDAMLSIGNKDLLSFIDYQSKNQVSINGDQITITGNPITTDNGTLAELHYKVYLTKDSTSDISFKNIIFNNANADYANCVATVQGGANNSFDYEFICGERTISSFLKGGELRINSISPNPTRGEITLSLDSPTKQEAAIEIYDILGKQVYSSIRAITKGKNTLSIDTKELPRGRYSIRINQSASSAFVKE